MTKLAIALLLVVAAFLVLQFVPDQVMLIELHATPGGFVADETLPALIKSVQLVFGVHFSSEPSATLTIQTEDGTKLSVSLAKMQISINSNIDITAYLKDFSGKKVHLVLSFDKDIVVQRYSPVEELYRTSRDCPLRTVDLRNRGTACQACG